MAHFTDSSSTAPVPRKKEGRAARLAAMMERDGQTGGPMIDTGVGNDENSGDNSDAQTPMVENAAEVEITGV